MKKKFTNTLLGVMIGACVLSFNASASIDYEDTAVIKRVQEVLNSEGYDCGTPDGIVGTSTKNAIQAYRKDNNLADGVQIDDELFNSISNKPSDSVSTNTDPETSVQQTNFLFRNIPWYCTKSDAEKLLEADGATVERAAFIDNILRMSGIDFLNTTSGRDRVEGGGIVGRYTGINVAGYDVSEAGACYIYTINDDGTIDKTEDTAKFYFGWYAFDSNDYVDGEGVYNDLSQKLTSLYGTGENNDEDDYFSTITWFDSDSNQIRLLLGGKNKDYKYVTLGYIAADADVKLDEMQAALDVEATNAEAEEREANKDNVSGL